MGFKTAVYPGSFDPVTMGHIDIILRGLEVFDKIIVAVANNTTKTPLFSVEERVELIKNSVKDYQGVVVTGFQGLLVDYLEKVNVQVILRGLRAISDFEYEFQIANMNARLNPDIETVFLMTSEKYFYISSSVIKEVARFGGNISELVPIPVEEALKTKFSPDLLT
ncbi:MAG: pantetheine-phosphate adenylyltransferase [Deltaproteobacteria bacterium]|jgi:pantetheine-phosphate adenylyltransferase|nr:pantetheine-phosphate adenylyltransferase [Deltaproteobacteria bacterium]